MVVNNLCVTAGHFSVRYFCNSLESYFSLACLGGLAEMSRILPITARLRCNWLDNRAISDCASETIELAPAVDREQSAAISLPSEFDRVIALQEETTLEVELDRLRPGRRRHAPTIAYRIDNAVLAQGSLYFKGGYNVIRGGSPALLPRQQDRFTEMQLCTNYVIERYFGHWLIEGLGLELLANQMSLQGLVLSRKPWLHEPEYRKMSGMEAVQTDNGLVDRLWVVDDRGINHNWISRIRELRRRVQAGASRARTKRIFLTRGTLGASRNLANSNEVRVALEKIGFEIINPEIESAGSIVDALSAAEIAVLVEGSVQSHCIYGLPVGSTLLTIQPPARFNANSKDRADAVGLNWAFVVADPHSNGFYLPVDRLLRTIDEVSSATERRAMA
jgi:hypothetical protein